MPAAPTFASITKAVATPFRDLKAGSFILLLINVACLIEMQVNYELLSD